MAAAARSYRPRLPDIHRKMEIVRDLSLLDSTEGLPTRDVVHGHMALDADNEKPKMLPAVAPADGAPAPGARKDGKEIPIPGVHRVPSYERDYLPSFRERHTYLRGKGGVGYEDPTLVEYDLDAEDEAWLASLCADGQPRLPPERLEAMLWRLELANAAATERALAFAGAAPAERASAAAAAITDHLTRDEALAVLEESCPARAALRAAAYEYWVAKRAARGAPLLRRLRAPTPANDQNPFNVFRPRAAANRPTTRRRRENNEDALEKLRMLRANVAKALELLEALVRRERKKRDLVYVETDMQRLQLRLRSEPRAAHAAVEAEYAAAAKAKNPKRPLGFESLPEAAPASTNALLDFKNRRGGRKRRARERLGEAPLAGAVAALPPPPPPPGPLGWPAPRAAPALAALEAAALELPPAAAVARGRVRPRVGRGGRLVLDRVRPLELEPEGLRRFAAEGEPEGDDDFALPPPVHARGANPYAEWLGRGDLAAAALARLDAARAGGAPPEAPGGAAAAGDAAAAPAAAADGGAAAAAVEPPPAAAANGDAAAAAAAPDGGGAAADGGAAAGAKRSGARAPRPAGGRANGAAS